MSSDTHEAPINVFGAVVFFLYIAAALVCTADIVKHVRHSIRTYNATILLYIALAVSSFSLLSYNMLSFLIVSYQTFYGHLRAPSIASIWTWASHSQLFTTFAQDLLLHADRWRWVKVSLLGSYAIELFLISRCGSDTCRLTKSYEQLTYMQYLVIAFRYVQAWCSLRKFCLALSHWRLAFC